ncbi:MAG: hypothetical protein IJO78_06360 [Erysipelotrichaceae bacterium]|nr:hypothetical protein [Erysipelotrichaceae bacterium]
MKKLLLGLLLVFMVVSLAACGGNSNNAGGNVEGDLPTLMTELYAGIDEENLPMLGQMEISDDETFAWIIGAQEGFVLEGVKEAYVSEPMMGSIAHTVLLVRMEEGADVEAAKKAIKDNVNPRKWICVGVDDEKNVIVDNRGDLIVLIMENNHAQTIHENFKNLK